MWILWMNFFGRLMVLCPFVQRLAYPAGGQF